MLQVAAAAGHSTAVATIATVTAAVQATWGSEKDKLGNPTEWYVADDAVSHTRYFVIQGSDSIDHWKVNLTFDPVVFEDPSLGVKVCPSAFPALLLVCRLTCHIPCLPLYSCLCAPLLTVVGTSVGCGKAESKSELTSHVRALTGASWRV